MPAYCVKLDKVPGLPFEARATFKKVLATNKQMGVHNVPRFNPDHLAQLGQVRIHCLLRAYISVQSRKPHPFCKPHPFRYVRVHINIVS